MEDLDVENVTDSWVDRHSLLPKEMQVTLNQERVKLESPKENPLGSISSTGNAKRDQPQYMRSINAIKWMSKIFKTGSEKQKFLNRKHEKLAKKRTEKDTNCLSARHYPAKNEIRYNSYSYRFEKKSIFSMPNLGLFAEKFHLKSKNEKKLMRGSLLKTRKAKNFVKKNREFKDEISGGDEKKRIKEELVKGKRPEKIKAVQSMCTSAIQNITDSKILIVKTRSGKEIKNKMCLGEVKQILKDFRKDFEFKQSKMRENDEDILDLRSSMLRLESDIKQAQETQGMDIDTRAKQEEIRQITQQIRDLENTNQTLSGEMCGLTSQIERLKKENEDNLKQVTKVVQRKFREIESRNKHERQVQKDIILKYNVELESKNTEINDLIRQYHELRLLNEDLSKEISQVRRQRRRGKSSQAEAIQKKFKTKSILERKKSRSRLADEQMMWRTNISQNAIMKSVSDFEESLQELDKELEEEGKRLEMLSRAKEKSKKQLYELEMECKRKNREVQKNRGQTELQNQLVQLTVERSNKAKSLEMRHRMLKVRRETLNRLGNATNLVRANGKKLISGTIEQLRSILLGKEDLKKKEKLIQGQAKKEKYLSKVNKLKEEKIHTKNTIIEKMKDKITQLENQVIESKKFKIIRDKSNVSRKEFRLKKAKKNNSTNNLEILPRRKQRLYHHNTGKTGSHTNFYKNINKKFMSETLNSIQSGGGGRATQAVSRKLRKSSTISRVKAKSKMQNREELGKKYENLIKNNYKNVLGRMGKTSEKKISGRRTSKKKPRNMSKFGELRMQKQLRATEAELEDLSQKYAQLEKKYMETHNDLLRSNNSVKVEALRIKKKSERSLQKSLRMVNESRQTEKRASRVEMRDKCVGISLTIPIQQERIKPRLK